MVLTEKQIKAVEEFMEIANVSRLRRLLIDRFLSDMIANPIAYTKKELEEIRFVLLMIEGISEA